MSTKTHIPTLYPLPNEILIKSLAYLGTKDLLHSAALVCRSFLELSSDDSIWYPICQKRWEGKLNVSRFYVNTNDLTTDSEQRARSTGDDGEEGSRPRNEDILQLRTGMTYCNELIHQFGSPQSVPPLNMGHLIHQPNSWKESYWMAEMDSRRETISREELVLFRFKLIYMGNPSRMGLRQFNEDGSYDSPYMGQCEWMLRGRHLFFAGMSLLVERDHTNWGWIIGRGERTEYYSV